MKYLVLFAVLAVVYLVWRARNRPPADTGTSARANPATATPLAQDMVRCPVCAVHLPRGEAVTDPQGRLFCSHEHRERARP